MASKKTAPKAAVEMVDVIDKDDNVIGVMTDAEAVTGKRRFRIVHVILVNDDDTMLLQWRGAGKELSPRTFTASAAGKVLAGESYEEAAHRELKEEMGATKVKLKLMGSFKTARSHGQLFAGEWNGEPKGWEAEADAIDYLNRDEAEYLMQRYPYLLSGSFTQSLKLFLKATK